MSKEDTNGHPSDELHTGGDSTRRKEETNARPKDDLNLLGSPFAYTPAPADLIDLWDETDRFFDALGDPNEFIEPEGEPTYQVNSDLDPSLLAKSSHKEANKEPSKEPIQLFDELSTDAFQLRNSSADHEHQRNDRSPLDQSSERRSSTLRSHPESHQNKPSDQSAVREDKTKEPSRPSLAERFTKRHRLETKVIVIAGGKGGVGRSLISANLALSLSSLSKEKVGIVDLDPVGGNLHTYLGLDPILEMPGKTLRGEVKPVSQTVPQAEVVLTRSGRPLYGVTQDKDRELILAEALSLQPKWLIVDAGHLPDPFTLKLFTSALYSLIVYTPDPSSVERGHRFLQAALYSQLIDQGDEASVIARSLLTADHEGVVAGPRSLARSLKHVHSVACESLEQRINRFTPHIIMNKCRTQSDRGSSDMICSILKRKWSITPVPLGSISFHHVAQQSLRERQALNQLFPSAPISLDIDKITRALLKRDTLQLAQREPNQVIAQAHAEELHIQHEQR